MINSAHQDMRRMDGSWPATKPSIHRITIGACLLSSPVVDTIPENDEQQRQKALKMEQSTTSDNLEVTNPYGSLKLPYGQVSMPVFMPDATLGVVRAVDATDLLDCQVQAVVMNTFHLMQRPGSSTIRALGGLHRMTGWTGPIVTDSGGFQAYSLIRDNPRYGTLDDRGIVFRSGEEKRKFQLTPEKCVQLQMSYHTDVVICLDACTQGDDPIEVQRTSVERTIAWARRCKREYLHLLEQRRVAPEERPLIFAVIQGGPYRELRERCATELL